MKKNLPKNTLRASAVLTTDYVGTTSIDATMLDGLAFFVHFTKGSLTSYEIKVQFSPDLPATADASSSWADMIEADGTVWVGSYTDTELTIYVPTTLTGNEGVIAQKARVTVKGTGTVTSSLCDVCAVRRVG